MSSTFFDERYAADEYAYGREPNDFVRAEASRIPRGRVLCLAEGEGRNAVYLAGLGHRVTAVDRSSVGLAKAERLARERGVELELVQADLADYAIPEDTFTGIVSVFGHVPADLRRKLHAQVSRALRPGGWFLLEAYSPAQLQLQTGGPRDLALLVPLDAVREELATLELVIAREVERDVVEGRFHTGRAATVQIAATRR